MSNNLTMHATTIVTVRKGGKVVIAGDGQVSLGQTVMKGNARKVRRIGANGNVIAGSLDDATVTRLYAALRDTLSAAVAAASGKPAAELKDAKRAGMRVHGRTGESCPECGDIVREVSFADSSLQYCATCQTGGKPLADRRTSKFLK